MRAKWMRWHRRVGLTAALLVLLAAVTGILIEHADGLGFARQHVHAGWLLRFYGLEPTRCERAFDVQGHWWSQCGTRLLRDGKALDVPPLERLVGVQPGTGGSWLVADRRGALLLSPEGAFADHLPYPRGLDAAQFGAAQGLATMQASDGSLWTPNADATAWQPAKALASSIVWQQAAPLPDALREPAEAVAPAGAPTVEQVLLDVHAGRWLGPVGPWLMDAAALALILLAATGVWTWWHRRRSKEEGRHHHHDKQR